MPAESEQQQKAAGMALAAKRGDIEESELQGAAKNMYNSMSEEELEEIDNTDRDDISKEKNQ